MEKRSYSTEEVLSFLGFDEEGEVEQCDYDDPQEVLLEGSDEEFDHLEDLQELENGRENIYNNFLLDLMYNCYVENCDDMADPSEESWQPQVPRSQMLQFQHSPLARNSLPQALPIHNGDTSPVTPVATAAVDTNLLSAFATPPSPLASQLVNQATSVATPTLSAVATSPSAYSSPLALPLINQATPAFSAVATPYSLSTNQATSVEAPWSRTLTPHAFVPPTPVGPTLPIPDRPIDIFRLFFTSDLIQEITDETNRYAREVMGPAKYESWTKVTTEELEAYLGFFYFMGLNPKPSLSDYWSTNPIFHYPPIASRISRDRYRELNRYLHFVDNTTLSSPGSPSYDRLGKIRPTLEYLSARFKEVYQPGQEIAVDEAMIKFQGRSSLKQYMPKKPIKRGIKVWVLADSSNGYFSRLEVYTGKKGDTVEKNLGARVVKELTKDFQQKWYHVYFDNFFTSKSLLCDLLKVGLYGIGTAQSNRKYFPDELKKVKMKAR